MIVWAERANCTHLLPGMRFDLRKLEFGVVRIHLANLFPGWCAKHFDDLNKLVDARVAWKDGLAKQKLGEHAPGAPDVNLRRVINGAKYQLWRPVVAAANVRHVRFTLHKMFSAAEVAQFQHACIRRK